jgi:hypothetical protein
MRVHNTPDFHDKTDKRTGDLYGKWVHPKNRALDEEGIRMVANTHSSQLEEIDHPHLPDAPLRAQRSPDERQGTPSPSG